MDSPALRPLVSGSARSQDALRHHRSRAVHRLHIHQLALRPGSIRKRVSPIDSSEVALGNLANALMSRRIARTYRGDRVA
eukprot:scaffold130188_cov28-Tisochrysis_lutea.AAC.8